ncbi:MAG: PAS domain S-box protein [Bacteroidetes bacterium]|nr:MAG: PAS domain S-box protein [Bacteroidota bacterium]
MGWTHRLFRSLMVQEAHLSVLFSTPHVGLMQLGAGGEIRSISANIAGLLEYEKGELEGLPISQILARTDPAKGPVPLLEILDQRPSHFQVEQWLRSKGGKEILLGISGGMRVHHLARKAEVTAMIQNVTPLEETRQRLQHELNEKNALIHATTDPIWAVDDTLHLRAFNKAYAGMHPAPPEVGDPVWLPAAGSEEEARWQRHYQRALAGAVHSVTEEAQVAGRTVPLAITFYPVWHQDAVTGVSVFARDISERLQAQAEKDQAMAALAARNHFIETTLDNLPIGIAVRRIHEGEVTYVNPVFAQTYDWPIEVLTDPKTFFEKVYPDPAYRAQVMSQVMADLESGDPRRRHWENLRVTTQTGDTRIISAKNIPLYDRGLMISTVVD